MYYCWSTQFTKKNTIRFARKDSLQQQWRTSTPYFHQDTGHPKKKIRKETPELNSVMDQVDLKDVYKTFHPEVWYIHCMWNILRDRSCNATKHVSTNLEKFDITYLSWLQGNKNLKSDDKGDLKNYLNTWTLNNVLPESMTGYWRNQNGNLKIPWKKNGAGNKNTKTCGILWQYKQRNLEHSQPVTTKKQEATK